MSEETIYTLGKTGDTVIHVFPDGHARMDRKAKDSSQQLPNAQSTEPGTEPESEAFGQSLVQAGSITPGQYQVALHDQTVTGMALKDALVARGWLTPENSL